jgi:AcrR family transcriptional regulator
MARETMSSEAQTVPELRARRRPRQLRSQITVTALLDATKLVLLERGYTGATTNLVADVAGVGIGSLYEYFPNKEALVAGLIERETDSFVTLLHEAMLAARPLPFADALRCWLERALSELEARRELLAVLMREYPYMTQLPTIRRLPLRVSELAAVCLSAWADRVNVSDQPATYYVLANMLGGAYLCQVLRPSAAVPRAAMLDSVHEVLLRVLAESARPASREA